MSTRVTIKHHDQEDGTGFHVFEDMHDFAPVIHLQLTGVAFEANSSGFVHVSMPAQLALRLGIIDAERAAAIEQQYPASE